VDVNRPAEPPLTGVSTIQTFYHSFFERARINIL
jgi:hypothetical protein